jgi:hypothetical protein
MHLLLILFGVFRLVNKEIQDIAQRESERQRQSSLRRSHVASVGGALLFPRYDLPLMLGALTINIVVGLATAERVEAPPQEPDQSGGAELGETESNPNQT